MAWVAVAIGGSALVGAYSARQGQKGQEAMNAANLAADERYRAEESAMTALYRKQLADLYADPGKFMMSDRVQIPLQRGTDMLARSLSVQGNPMGSGNALQALQDHTTKGMWGAFGEEADRLGGFGLRAQRPPMQGQYVPNYAASEIGAGLGRFADYYANKPATSGTFGGGSVGSMNYGGGGQSQVQGGVRIWE